MNRSNRRSADALIVRALLEAGGDFVSGAELARELGTSRVTVWQHMEKLREQGFEFEGVRSRGYRLVARPEALNALLIEARLVSPGCRVTVLDSIDSTNDEATRRLAEDESTPFVVIARQQTKGRGRLGRTWVSEPNGNLYISFGLRPAVPPAEMPTITPWIGVNLCDLLTRYARVPAQVKWPNDLQIAHRKMAGILTEARIDADRIRELVIGCGINVRTPASGWPADLKGKVTALDEHTDTPIDLNHLAAAVIGRVLTAYEQLQRGQHHAKLSAWWCDFDALRDRDVTLYHGRTPITGRAVGIDPDGSLLLQRNGEARPAAFRAGEVTLSGR